MENTWSVRRLRPRGPAAAAAAPVPAVEPTPSKPRKAPAAKKKPTAAKKAPAPKSKPKNSRTKKEETQPQEEEQEQAQDERPARDDSARQERPIPLSTPRLSHPMPRLSPPFVNISTRPNTAGSAGNDESPTGDHWSPQRSVEVSPPSPPRGSSSHHESSSATLQDDTPVRRPDSRFGVQLTVDTPEASTFIWERPVDELPRPQRQERPFDEAPPRLRRPQRPTFLESTPRVVSQPAMAEREDELLYGLPIHRARRVKSCLCGLVWLFVMLVLGLGLLLVIEDAHRFRNLEDGEVLLLPVHQPVLDLSNVLMGFPSGLAGTDKLLRRSSAYIDNMCQGPNKWEELRTYKPRGESFGNDKKSSKARRNNMTSLFLSSANDDGGMRAVVKLCQDAKELTEALSRAAPTIGTAQKMALQDTARVIEEIQTRLTTTPPQDAGSADLKGSLLSWIRPEIVSNHTTLWEDQQQVMNNYLLSFDKLGKDVTKVFEEVTVEEEPVSRAGTSKDELLIGGSARKKAVPVWKRWLRHPLGSSLELAHLFKNDAVDFHKLSQGIADIETHMSESCQNQDAKKRPGCPYTWDRSKVDRPTLDLDFHSLESRDKARKIAGALDWIDLERQVLRTILNSESSKGPGLLDGQCEVVLDSIHEGTGALISTRGWIHPDPIANRGQAYSALPICAPTRVFRPSTEKYDCKLPGSEDYWHDVLNMMGHTFGLPSRFDTQVSFKRDRNEDSKNNQQTRDILWRHDLKISQKSSVWWIVKDQVPHPTIKRLRTSFFWGSSPLRGFRLPSVEEQDIRLTRAVERIRMFLWQYL
ncbi:unnamed protein product [Clonostachys rosea f. rosea IK726]|uniref:Uncharacterized protein n=1 Tax=Clonostachys rosea f. rosea IK726 TaxID=1349383 RepID=A0ACA9TZH5_BIOOC|nr:unnamed protein product [Clonostachys rosea f. rosea IK726]